MSSIATNSALKNVQDEAAILLNFWAAPRLLPGGQAQQASTQLERWRQMTAWVFGGGGIVILSEEANFVNNAVKAINPCLNETHIEIEQLESLEDDWNDEGARPITRACITRAEKFVQYLACEAADESFPEHCAPAVFPTIDGGVQLYWKANGRQVSLTFRPTQESIEVMEKTFGEPASHRPMSEGEAGLIALKAMRESI